MKQPFSIVKLKDVPPGESEVWVDLSPYEIKEQIDNGYKFIYCARFRGGMFYPFICAVDSIVVIEPYRT